MEISTMEADEDAITNTIARERYGPCSKVAVALDTNISARAMATTKAEDASGDWLVASALTNYKVHIYKGENLNRLQILEGHETTITDLKFNKSNSNVLYTSSLDGTIRIWDLRQGKTVKQLRDDTEETLKPLSCFDINCNDTYVCAGTELVITDAYVLFWDLRKSKLMGGYWESHTDDVTQVAFHPQQPVTLATCSTDGLINVFDIGESTEDDALKSTLNTESSVDIIRWHRDKNRISCLTHIETLQMWDVEETELLKTFCRDSIAKELRIKSSPARFISLAANPKTDAPAVITAFQNNSALLMELSDDATVQVHTLLTGVHKSPLVSVHWNVENDWAITSDESAVLCYWKKGCHQSELMPKDTPTIKKSFGKAQTRRTPY